eukprot:CAMPEP_0197539322 /NCGR_PEP_ID=MMETSP1318-20131121/62343_1 /TAXON_ID=552666 /ORGANISM="Partenskyella glossopodia, Strain RCC365" /LENGTH=452 /DNA_ID=CAMNT_0043098007 /DNA_START=59 /DNA_END=1417 /DNA_ORIENTATION=-
MPKNHVALTLDFGSNHSFAAMNQTQGGFFSPVQSTVFPIICYHWKQSEASKARPGPATDDDYELWAVAYDILSNDLSHDVAVVQQGIRDVVELFKKKLAEDGRVLEGLHCWSDGCRSQFKNRDYFAFATCLQSICGVKCDMNFFCSCHGKGSSDSETAHVHRQLRAAQEQKRIDSAREGFNRLKAANAQPKNAKLKDPTKKKKHQLLERHLVFMDAEDIDRKLTVHAAKGSEGAVTGSNDHYRFGGCSGVDGELVLTWMACKTSCKSCMTFKYADCDNILRSNYKTSKIIGTKKPKEITLKLKNPFAMRRPVASRTPASDDAEPTRQQPPSRRSSRRTIRGWVGQVKKGFTFCVRSQLEGEGGGLLYAVVKDYEPHAAMVWYNVHQEIEDGVWTLDTKETHVCSIGDMLRPFNYKFAVVDARSKQYSIPQRVASQFMEAVEALKSDGVDDEQ